MPSVSITSFNVRGLQTSEKRSSILTELWRSRTQIAFLQETHFKVDKVPKFSNVRFPTAYHAPSLDSKSKGVSIIIGRNVEWTYVDRFADSEGRILMVKGEIGGRRVTLVTVYAPNVGQMGFLVSFWSQLMQFAEGIWIIGGDFNFVQEPSVDSSGGKSKITHAQRKRIKRGMFELQLVDPWRTMNPKERDYTHFSVPHQSYSRIDFFLIQHATLSLVSEVKIGVSAISDHSPIHLSLELSPENRSPFLWRLNESLIQDPEFIEEIRSELVQFFLENDGSVQNPLILWEAHKCVIRGVLVKIGTIRKQQRIKRTEELYGKLKELELRHRAVMDRDTWAELTQIRMELNELLLDRVKAQMSKSRRLFYEFGNKPGRMLANALKDSKSRTYIPSIRTGNGGLVVKSEEIAAQFHSYFVKLYNLRGFEEENRFGGLHDIQAYLASTGMSVISESDSQVLEKPITEEEFEQALKLMKSGKAPGPDGLTLGYYKKFGEILRGRFIQAYNSIREGNELPRDSLRAHIALLPKEGKDLTNCGNYRPISLLNVDLKVFTRILASRLLPLMGSLISQEQVGFVPGREARDNTIRTLNVIHLAKSQSKPLFLLSLDAEKAFDRVNWIFLKETLRYVGLGKFMQQWIGSLYTNPSAVVRVNGIFSESVTIENGTRQGCPLSPLIFILTLEPLIRTIQKSQDIKGLETRSGHHKISAYADDLLLYISQPEISIPNILKALDTYGGLSGFKLNLGKSEALNISIPEARLRNVKANFQFKWATSYIKYLGVFISADLQKIFS